ncbi:MAG: NUDIX domain-containing protein [Candidatus Nanoarchaeia archaeon]|nr:NUDIX domain-containing protein [Candidatus Nanoarchaeia archaeon]MDD5357612.1 NUDIX domain-containing protein [Candidatus Nanoarchaeia archaeon]MDD5588531.1 NUDIX domain-containing protein [Candidatus Nanoarchaeia archaeon]
MKKGKYRNAVFVVVYAKENYKTYYLILKRKLHWNGWEFPKGGTKPFFIETKMDAVRRELREETGLKILKIKKFDIWGKYKYRKKLPDRKGIVGQKFYLYAAEVEKGKVKIDKLEHSGYKWADFKGAIKKLTWDNQKKCLEAVDEFLKRKG